MVSDSGELSVCLQQSSYSGFSFEVLKKAKKKSKKYIKTQINSRENIINIKRYKGFQKNAGVNIKTSRLDWEIAAVTCQC